MRKLFNVLGLLAFLLVSCDNASVDEKVAQQNIQQYLEEMIGTNMPTGYVIDEYKHSKLYILEPKNESKIVKPKVEKGDTAAEFEHLLHSMDNVVGLALSGCKRGVIETIIKNDANYREWGTGAKEYVMVTFVNFINRETNDKRALGFCVSLSEELNIENVYMVEDEDEDYIYIRLFGESSGRFYGAVKCQFDYLERMYEYYVESLEEDKYSIDMKFVIVKELNRLFECEYFEIMEDKEACVTNCLESLNYSKDLKILKDRAYAKIKSFE